MWKQKLHMEKIIKKCVYQVVNNDYHSRVEVKGDFIWTHTHTPPCQNFYKNLINPLSRECTKLILLSVLLYSQIFAYSINFLLEKMFPLHFMGNLFYSLLSCKEQILSCISTERVNTKMFLSYNLQPLIIDHFSKLKVSVQWFSL